MFLGMQISKIPMENNIEIPRSLNIELPYDQVILLLDIYTKKHKSGYNWDTVTSQQYSQKPSFGITLWALQVMNGSEKSGLLPLHDVDSNVQHSDMDCDSNNVPFLPQTSYLSRPSTSREAKSSEVCVPGSCR
jgi:hypothetical protein